MREAFAMISLVVDSSLRDAVLDSDPEFGILDMDNRVVRCTDRSSDEIGGSTLGVGA